MQSVTVQRAAKEREAEEQRILAESALVGERAVSILRILTWLLLGAAFSAAEGGHDHSKAPLLHVISHMGLILGWFVFAVAVAIVLRKVKFTPRRARVWPAIFTAVDFGVFTGLSLSSGDTARADITFATLAILVTFSVARFNTFHVVFSAAMGIGCYLLQGIALGFLDFSGGIVAVAAYACLGAVVWWANRRVRKMFVDVRRSENLARFLPRQVANRILAVGGGALAPVHREVTILFSDIRDFTTMSQRMDPTSVLKLLDVYFARMSEIVKGHDGMVNKFLGDGMLAVWGVPDATKDHAASAVKAALHMREAVAELNAKRDPGTPEIRIGIGIHTGPVAAGMLGGPDQHEYTVIGDAVNLASRVEGLTKRAGADILATESTWAQCNGAFDGERVGSEAVKGRDEPVVIYRVDRTVQRSAA